MHRKVTGAGSAGAMAALALGLAACSSPTATGVIHLPPRTTTTLAPTTTTTPQQAVITGYVAAETAFGNASLAMNASDPALVATSVDPALSQNRALLTVEKGTGVTVRGHQDLGQPVVVAYSATRAVVHSCEPGPGLIAYGQDGKPLTTSLGQAANVDVTAVMVPGPTGTWMLQSGQDKVVPLCPD